VVTLIVVLFVTVTLVPRTLPKLTVAPAAKPVPEIVTLVPPPMLPVFGETDVTVGAEEGGGAVAVVKLQTGLVAVLFAIVLPTMRQ
jgi:hypothetical protein